jgi:hypothetical protein
MTILINKYFGPSINSSFAIANTVSEHSSTLSNSLITAFSPAITNICGSGNENQMKYYSFIASKFSAILLFVFFIPLVIEMPYILKIWLKNPPEYTDYFCYSILVMNLIDKMSSGEMMAISAKGKIALYQFTLGVFSILILFFAWFLLILGYPAYSVVIALVTNSILITTTRVIFAKKMINMSMRLYMKKILIPLITLSSFCVLLGITIRLNFNENLLRLILNILIIELIFIIFLFFFMFEKDEILIIKNKIRIIVLKIKNIYN